MSTPTWVFDQQHTKSFTEGRIKFLDEIWSLLPVELGASVIDVGCGLGDFSGYLSAKGLKVLGVDGRQENVREAQTRFPAINFQVQNAEDLAQVGQFDLSLCFGLLYHLENPFRAIRNLYQVTQKFSLIESLVVPSKSPIAYCMSENFDKDQGLDYVAFISSESALIKMLYRAGFKYVYMPAHLPDHDEFQAPMTHKRRRTMLFASNVQFANPFFTLVTEPEKERPDLWTNKQVVKVERGLKRLRRFFKSPS